MTKPKEFKMLSVSKTVIIELTFRVQIRLDFTTALKIARENEDEQEMMRIAKLLSLGEYRFSDEPMVAIDYAKVGFGIKFEVTFSLNEYHHCR